MSFLRTITDFFESIFMRSSPEVQKKQQLKKMDAEIRNFTPSICKTGELLPNFGEAIFSLYKNVRPLDDIFSETIGSGDVPRQHRFEAQLIVTGFVPEDQDIIDNFDFEARKQEILSEEKHPDRIYLRQRKNLDKILSQFNSNTFKTMDEDLLCLRKLSDFCHYNFVPFMQLFDSNFLPADFSYEPSYREVLAETAVNLLEDFYFQTCNFKITKSMAAAVIALYKIKHGENVSEKQTNSLMHNLKQINYVLVKVLPPEKIKAIIRYVKCDPLYEPPYDRTTGSPCKEFVDMIQKKFNADEKRIKSEIQAEQITSDLSELFGNRELENVNGYNSRINDKLMAETDLTFQWILPMKILKTFVNVFITEGIKNLLNDIVIEGFFNNPTYKTAFSTAVYSSIKMDESIKVFEDSFLQKNSNSIVEIEGLISDCHRDKDFYNKLASKVKSVNDEAYEIISKHTVTLHTLFLELQELLADAKKPASEIISNLKVLMMSSRNKDNTTLLEIQLPQWKIFFDIMKNYVIINNE